jgi:predicted acyl esterase
MLAASRHRLHILRASRHQLRGKKHLALPPRKDPWGIDAIMAPYFQFPEEDHPHVTIKNVAVTMRDGVELAATVFRPSFDGITPVSERLPVVLHRCVEPCSHGK